MRTSIKFISLKRITVLLSVLFLSSATYAQTGKRNKLSVLSYNIHHANPPSKAKEGAIDLEAIASLTLSFRPFARTGRIEVKYE